jgi:hypothetical protein
VSTASQQHPGNRTFRIIHPFHPFQNKEYEIDSIRTIPNERRVFFFNEEGCITSVPLDWTDIEPLDPWVVLSAGRALFRVRELLELAGLAGELKRNRPDERVQGIRVT